MEAPPNTEKKLPEGVTNYADPWAFHAAAQRFYEKFYNLIQVEPKNDEIMDIWQVRIPGILLRDLRGATNFGRNRWFITNAYATTADTRVLLQPTTPGFIEHQWENWKRPQPWLNLLNQWIPQFLQQLVGTPLGALQLLVDVADHLRMREVLPLDEKSRTMTALLTSAESLLKWPAHYLTLQRQESEHPLNELRSLAEQTWNKTKIMQDYLVRYATNFSPTQRLVEELYKELVLQLTSQEISLQSKPPTLGNAESSKRRFLSVVAQETVPETPQTPQNPKENRKRSAQEALLHDMREKSKLWRYDLCYVWDKPK